MIARGAPPSDTLGLLLVWVARHGVATAENLSIRFGLDECVVADTLDRGVERGLMRRAGVLVAEPELFVATASGLLAAGFPNMAVCRASARGEGHLRAVASAAVWLERKLCPRCDVLSERELQLALRGWRPGAPLLARPYVHHRGGVRKRPDLLIRPTAPAAGLPLAVEVELSRKSGAHLEAICTAWRHCGDVAGVLYLAAPELVDAVRIAAERAGAGRRVAVVALERSDVPRLRRRSLYRPQSCAGSGDHVPVRPHDSRALDALVRWAGRWGIVGVESLCLHLGLGRERVNELLGQAQNEGLLHCAVILRGEGPLCWATSRGLLATALRDLGPCAVNYSSAARGVAEAHVGALLEHEQPNYRAVSRRELSSMNALATLSALVSPRCRPSLWLVPRCGLSAPIAVFVESSPLAAARLAAASSTVAKHEDVTRAIVYASSAGARRALLRRVAGHGASDLVLLRTLPPALSRQV